MYYKYKHTLIHQPYIKDITISITLKSYSHSLPSILPKN